MFDRGSAVLTPRVGTVPQFVSYLVRSNAFTDRVTADSVGTAYPAIAESRLGSFHVPSPPLPEQAAIVRFLDHADRRIRRYILAKQKLDQATGGTEEGPHPPRRDGPNGRPHRPALPGLQALRRGVDRGRSGALGRSGGMRSYIFVQRGRIRRSLDGYRATPIDEFQLITGIRIRVISSKIRTVNR